MIFDSSAKKEPVMKHPLKIVALALAALVMLAYATYVDAKSKDVPSLVSVSLPGGGMVDIRIDNCENPSKNRRNKTLLVAKTITSCD
jgi:hypothetical protein